MIYQTARSPLTPKTSLLELHKPKQYCAPSFHVLNTKVHRLKNFTILINKLKIVQKPFVYIKKLIEVTGILMT